MPIRNKKVGRKGLTFVIVLAFILILAIAAATFIVLGGSEIRMARRQRDSTKAFYLAEAGVERAIVLLGEDFTEDPPGEGQLFDLRDGRYRYDVAPTEVPNQLRVTGTGYVPDEATPGRAERAVEVLITKASIFDVAAFGEERVSLYSNARTDSYDSEKGEYGGGNVGSNGDVGTNGIAIDPAAISLDSNASVDGDAVIGSGGDPEKAIKVEGNAEITGTRSAAGSEKELPQITAPTGLPDKGSISLGANETLTISENGKYSSVHLDGNSTLTIDADATIYVTGTLAVDSNSKLQIANDATVTIYIDGALRVHSNAEINNLSQDPTKLDIYGTDSLTSVSFDSNSVYYGTIYARKADIILDSNINFYGSIIANGVSLDSNAAIHYDEALGRKTGGPGSTPKISSWREI